MQFRITQLMAVAVIEVLGAGWALLAARPLQLLPGPVVHEQTNREQHTRECKVQYTTSNDYPRRCRYTDGAGKPGD